jgi:hypothetical protein
MNTQNTTDRPEWWLSAALFALVMVLALLNSACEPGEMPGGLAQLPATTEEALPAEAPPAEAGPQAWIEYPLEGQTLPSEEPVTFVVYATDAQGVAQVELRVNGQPLPAAPVEGISPDGSKRLVRLGQAWKPDKEGEYIAEARGRSAASAYGEPAYVKFCVGSCKPASPTPTPAPFITETPAPSIIADTPTPAPLIFTTEIPAPATQYDLYVRRMDFNLANPLVGETIQLFIMIATDIYPSQGPYFPASRFRWRQGPNFPWREEACPDNARYASCTKTVSFSYAQPGTYTVEVEADSGQEVAETTETNNAKSWTITVGQQPTPTYTRAPTYTPRRPTPTSTPPPQPTEAPLPGVKIDFWTDAQYINAGQCTTLHWHVEGVQAVYLDGQGVVGVGEKQVCPCQDTTYTLRVVHVDSTETTHSITIYVSGQCGAPPTEAPPPPAEQPTEAPPPPPQDTTGPGISGVGLTWEGCSVYGQATISDPSGVGRAQFHFNIDGGEDHGLWMKDLGGGYYQTEYSFSVQTGIGSPQGKIEYYVLAGDALGNQSQSSSGSCSFLGCGTCQ